MDKAEIIFSFIFFLLDEKLIGRAEADMKHVEGITKWM